MNSLFNQGRGKPAYTLRWIEKAALGAQLLNFSRSVER